MASALFYLTKHQTIYKKLQSIGDALPKKDYDSIKNIPLLDGIINETLRLRPVIPSGQPRVTPANGMQIDEYHIPGDVNVILPQWVIQQDERYFEDAKSFIPERWTPEKSHMVKDRNAFFPFQLGKFLY